MLTPEQTETLSRVYLETGSYAAAVRAVTMLVAAGASAGASL